MSFSSWLRANTVITLVAEDDDHRPSFLEVNFHEINLSRGQLSTVVPSKSYILNSCQLFYEMYCKCTANLRILICRDERILRGRTRTSYVV